MSFFILFIAVFTEASQDLGFFKKDSPYYIQQINPYWNLILSEEHQSLSPYLKQNILNADKTLSSLFKKPLGFRTGHLFFSSSRYQFSNALASFYMRAFVQVYPSNEGTFIDLWSLSDWSRNALIHEINHIYQLGQNSYWDNHLGYLYGLLSSHSNNWITMGVLTRRNFFLPLWILEGDSVLMESLYGSGGRLWSGAARAFVFSQIKEDTISLKRLFNFYSDPFSSNESYLHGAFFFAYLHSLYGLKKVKNFFYESAKTFPIGYYGLKGAFKRAFDKDINKLFESYKTHYKQQAQKQQSASTKVLLKSKVFSPINSDKKSLYFLISDLKSPAQLILWNKKKQKFKKRRAYLPMGKVFKKRGKYFSVSHIRTKTNAVEYTLVGEPFRPISQYNSQYVMDFYKNQPLFLDMKSHHQGNSLYLGNEFYDKVHSSALVDNKGSVYYFKQEDETRVLYKNKKPLVNFKGYFSYPVEVNTKEVYFIAPTQYGSSLFVYREGQGIERLSESDRIVSARQSQDNQFLIVEISPKAYEYKLIRVRESLNPSTVFHQPVFYQDIPEKLSLNKRNLTGLIPETEKELSIKKEKTETGTNTETTQAEVTDPTVLQASSFQHTPLKKYKAFPQLLFKSFGLNIFDSLYGFLNFEDPLNFNKLLISSLLNKNEKFLNLSYTHKKHRPHFEFSLRYSHRRLNALKNKALIDTFESLGFLEEEDRYSVSENAITSEEETQQNTDSAFEATQVSRITKKRREFLDYKTRSFSVGLNYPLLRQSESSLKVGSSFTLGQKKFSKSYVNHLNHTGSLKYRFSRRYPYAYTFHKKRELEAKYSLLFLDPKNIHWSYALKSAFVEDLGKELFFQLEARALWSLWNQHLSSLPIRSSENPGWSLIFFKQSIQDLYQLDISFLKVFNNNFRFLKVPLSFNRLAPLTGLSLMSFKKHHNPHNVLAVVPFLGTETEFAFLTEHSVFKLGMLLEAPFLPQTQSPASLSLSYLQLRIWLKSAL